MDVVATIIDCFSRRGNSQYGGERVTQLEHALQCAWLAEQSSATGELIVAALLHDIGHLLHDLPADAPEQGVDDHHETSGYRFLQNHFSLAVTEPVRQHVAAKRYLVAVDATYAAQLSEPSLVSLKLQGGAMTENELIEFRYSLFWEQALQLRRWDDLSKVMNQRTPGLEHYQPLIEQVALPRSL